MASIANIRLHPARLEHLKNIAILEACTQTEALEMLISRELRARPEIDRIDRLPLHVANGRVCPDIGDVGTPTFSPKEAGAFASVILKVLDGPKGRGTSLTFGADGEAKITVGRRGRGIFLRIEWPDTEMFAEETLTVSLARDYVRQLLRAAQNADTDEAA
ncbi:hypothetical protein U0C82_18790 [Fulvimarina sp. 2208YS6-2-32]|uniref:Uncharacterized protein n=1 Tax=Fulvimarina uroteuthidis TaxID=3098149 RepID=A0ABU5I8B3_9HYPH|nr:hypothetical protein [Fulvimarina sp. 2208YS6-2-32]MDY8111168.1 hypothetical protein [Fulvimarina sp. 2208YS6-2-32]